MTSRDFCFWLQGYFEISKNKSITSDETSIIKNHLNMVFKHEIDPSMGDEKHQIKLNNLHNPAKNPSLPPYGGINTIADDNTLIRC